MRSPNPEQELILVARAVGEIAARLEQHGEPLTGAGVGYTRRLVAAADAGTRGIDRSMNFPAALPPSAPAHPSGAARLEADATARALAASRARP